MDNDHEIALAGIDDLVGLGIFEIGGPLTGPNLVCRHGPLFFPIGIAVIDAECDLPALVLFAKRQLYFQLPYLAYSR